MFADTPPSTFQKFHSEPINHFSPKNCHAFSFRKHTHHPHKDKTPKSHCKKLFTRAHTHTHSLYLYIYIHNIYLHISRRKISQSDAGMANNQPPEGYAAADDFLEQILAIPSYGGLTTNDVGASSDASTVSQLSSAASVAGGGGLQHHHHHQQQQPLFPLGLSLDNGHDDVSDAGAFAVKHEREAVTMGGLYPPFEQLQPHAVPHPVPQLSQQVIQGQPTPSTTVSVPHPPAIRPRVRARRGQATDPHSIAERLRRERISERIKALQELVPSCNKTDRAAMLDEILDYVKFLRLQVKVLSMSRLGGASAVAQLVADIPLQSVEGDSGEGRPNHVWEKWSNEETEREVAKLMEEDVGAAMQYLQSKSLCIMPISLAALIYPSHQTEDPTSVKPEPLAPS